MYTHIHTHAYIGCRDPVQLRAREEATANLASVKSALRSASLAV